MADLHVLFFGGDFHAELFPDFSDHTFFESLIRIFFASGKLPVRTKGVPGIPLSNQKLPLAADERYPARDNRHLFHRASRTRSQTISASAA